MYIHAFLPTGACLLTKVRNNSATRVSQVYQGLVFMDFNAEFMKDPGFGVST